MHTLFRIPLVYNMMTLLTDILVGIVAFLHIYFLVLEMFLWDKPFGLKTFNQSLEAAAATKTLAMNQGLYNGFLAAGLIWGLGLGADGSPVKIFFLVCIVIAGVFSGITANRKIFFIQALPAGIALALLFIV